MIIKIKIGSLKRFVLIINYVNSFKGIFSKIMSVFIYVCLRCRYINLFFYIMIDDLSIVI